MITISKKQFLSLRFSRQHWLKPADTDQYDMLFRDVSPVNTVGWCEPGRPPQMPPHAAFVDGEYNFTRRAERKILKGHYGGRVGYVTADDLQLFACLYRKPIQRFTRLQHELLDLLGTEGPMNIGSMKEITGHRVKEITPALKRLQQAFLLFEDQADNEGDRAWFIFKEEFPETELDRYTKQDVLEILLPRFAHRAIFFNEENVKRFYTQPKKDIKAAMDHLVSKNILTVAAMDEQQGYVLCDDIPILTENILAPVPKTVITVQRNDFIARSVGYSSESKWDILYLLLIDGDINGSVRGRFRFGPHDIENIQLDLPESECLSRKNEILDAVYSVFDYTVSPYKRYNGTEIIP